MSILIHIKNPDSPLGLVENASGLEVVYSSTQVVALEPTSWAYLGTLFLQRLVGGFGEALGKSLGAALGNALADALGITARENSQIQDYLNRLSQEIIRNVRLAIDENEIRRAHASLASEIKQFSEYLRAPTHHETELPAIDARVSDIYQQLLSLAPRGWGATVVPGMLHAALIMITIGIRRYGTSERSQGEATNARLRITGFLQQLAPLIETIGCHSRSNIESRWHWRWSST